ncbi:MAG: plastocyanin/azurin family copper-binding protein [Gemmatimonadota bacterium]
MSPSRHFRAATVSTLAVLGLGLLPAGLTAQAVTDRTPNITGGWVGTPGSVHFNFLHRMRLTGADNDVDNSPTLIFAAPLPGSTILGVQYGTNSRTQGLRHPHEWEFFARWAPLPPEPGRVGVALTAAYNTTASSADGELTVSAPLGPIRLLAAGRAFSDAFLQGEPGWAVAGGAAWRIREGVALSADVGQAWSDADWAGEGKVWGAGLQLRIPTTPHTLSLQATNTRTGTLQGSSGSARQKRTLWGFEFTVPITLGRYIPALRNPTPARTVEPEATWASSELRAGEEVEVTMNNQLQFVPDTVRIQVGQTVVWTNPTPLPHTVTADPNAVGDPAQVILPEGAETFDSGNMFTGDEFRYTFTVPGTYQYLCVPHEMVGMLGVVIVEATSDQR